MSSEGGGSDSLWHTVQQFANARLRFDLVLPECRIDSFRRRQECQLGQILRMLSPELGVHVDLPCGFVLCLQRLTDLPLLFRLSMLLAYLANLLVAGLYLGIQVLFGRTPVRKSVGARDPMAIGRVEQNCLLERVRVVRSLPVQPRQVDFDHSAPVGLHPGRLVIVHGMSHANLDQQLSRVIPCVDIGLVFPK